MKKTRYYGGSGEPGREKERKRERERDRVRYRYIDMNRQIDRQVSQQLGWFVDRKMDKWQLKSQIFR